MGIACGLQPAEILEDDLDQFDVLQGNNRVNVNSKRYAPRS